MEYEEEISVEQFVQAVSDQKSKNLETAQHASQIIDIWKKQESSVQQSLDIITSSQDPNLRFFAIDCIQYFVRSDFENLGDELVGYILDVSKQQIVGNQSVISRNDMIKLIVLYADICCINPSQISILEELERKSQLIFTKILFEESRETFVNAYNRAPIQQEITNLHDFVCSLLSDFEMSAEYADLLIISSFEYFESELFHIYLEHFVDFLSNNLFHKYLNQFIENLCNKIDDSDFNELLIHTFQLYCACITPESEYFCESYARPNATLVYSCIFGYTSIFFQNNLEFANSILANFFENIPRYAASEPQFYLSLSNIENILISFVDGASPFAEYFNPFVDLISNMISEDPSLVSDEFAKMLYNIQDYNYNPSIIQYYEEKIAYPTTGLCYVASFVNWWDQKIELFEQLLANIFALDEIPSTTLKIVQRAVLFQLSDDILTAFLTLGLSSFETDPAGASLFLKVFAAHKGDKIIPYLPDIIGIVRPKFEEHPIKEMFHSITAILFLASKCPSAEDTQALAEDMGQVILGYYAAALEEGINAVDDALKSIGSIIRSSAETVNNPTLKEFYGALCTEMVGHLIELAGQLTDDISADLIAEMHCSITNVFRSMVSSKLISDEAKPTLTEYAVETLKTHPVQEHFLLLAEIGLPTLEHGEIAEIINSIDINDDVELTCGSLMYLMAIAKANIESFYSVYPDPGLVLRFLDSYSQQIQDHAMDALSQLLKARRIPEGFAEAVVENVVSKMEMFDEGGKKSAMDILTNSSIPLQDMYQIIISITGHDNTAYAAKIRDEIAKPAPVKRIIINNLKQLISMYACDNHLEQTPTVGAAEDDDLLI